MDQLWYVAATVTLRQVPDSSLSDRIFARLVAEIVGGRRAPGTALPSERSLTASLEVNRHVVREALGRLEQMGLIRITQGGATRVLDFRRTAGLDLLWLIAEHVESLEDVLPLLVDALELRATIGTDVARLAAERATAAERAEIAAAAEALATASPGERTLLDRRFWQLLLDSAGNLAYQLAFNSLIRAMDSVGEALFEYLDRELEASDHRRPIAAAVCAGDANAAEAATRAAFSLPPELAALRGRTSRSADPLPAQEASR